MTPFICFVNRYRSNGCLIITLLYEFVIPRKSYENPAKIQKEGKKIPPGWEGILLCSVGELDDVLHGDGFLGRDGYGRFQNRAVEEAEMVSCGDVAGEDTDLGDGQIGGGIVCDGVRSGDAIELVGVGTGGEGICVDGQLVMGVGLVQRTVSHARRDGAFAKPSAFYSQRAGSGGDHAAQKASGQIGVVFVGLCKRHACVIHKFCGDGAGFGIKTLRKSGKILIKVVC